MSNIIQAAKWLKEGKKVKRSKWAEYGVLKISNHGFLQFGELGLRAILIEEIFADDWIVVEEKTWTDEPMNRAYILLRDLPDAFAGDEYVWNGASYFNNNRTSQNINKNLAEHSKEWFEPKGTKEISPMQGARNKYIEGYKTVDDMVNSHFEAGWKAAEKHFSKQ